MDSTFVIITMIIDDQENEMSEPVATLLLIDHWIDFPLGLHVNWQ